MVSFAFTKCEAACIVALPLPEKLVWLRTTGSKDPLEDVPPPGILLLTVVIVAQADASASTVGAWRGPVVRPVGPAGSSAMTTAPSLHAAELTCEGPSHPGRNARRWRYASLPLAASPIGSTIGPVQVAPRSVRRPARACSSSGTTPTSFPPVAQLVGRAP